MVNGEIGVHFLIVPSHVEWVRRIVIGIVTIQLQHFEETIVQEKLMKQCLAMKIFAQVSIFSSI